MHHRIALQQADQLGTSALDIGQRIEQIKHAAAFGQQGFACRVVGADGAEHGSVLRQCHVVQFRIATRQVQAVGLWQTCITDRREKPQLGAHRPQHIETGAIGKGKRFVTGHGDAHASQQGLDCHHIGRGEFHRRRQFDFATAGQGLGRRIEAHIQVIQLAGLHQAKVSTRQFDPGLP
ncbi:hypothetical protein D3C76_1232040 [compost metagenome]